MRIPFAGLDAPPRVLGAMIGMRGEAAHGVVSQARPQALREARPVLGLGGRVAEHPGRESIYWNEVRRFDADRFDRPDDLKRGKFFLQETREAFGVACRRRETDVDACLDFLVHEDQGEPPDARLARGEQAFELHQEPPRGEGEPLGMDERCRQLEPCAEARRRLEEGARLGQRAEGVVDLVEEPPAAALREPIAW